MAEDSLQAGGDDALGAAIARLDAAMGALEHKIAARAVAHQAQDHDLFESDRARLKADLDRARAREKALEQVAAEASAALGRAAAEVRAALSAEEG